MSIHPLYNPSQVKKTLDTKLFLSFLHKIQKKIHTFAFDLIIQTIKRIEKITVEFE